MQQSTPKLRGSKANAASKETSLGRLVASSLFSAALGFYLGLFVGSSTRGSTGSGGSLEAQVQERVKIEVRRITQQQLQRQEQKEAGQTDDTSSRFTSEVHDFAVGLSRVSRNDFAREFDMGVPLDPSTEHNNEVLILYSQKTALPDDALAAREASSQTALPLLPVKDAVANCDFLNVILTSHDNRDRQCVALFGQYEAFHLQKWMRLPVDGGPLQKNLPLRLVNRGAQASGRKSTKPPKKEDTIKYWAMLTKYLSNLDTVLQQLQQIASKVAVNNTIIVMVCNLGQSELLLNFICTARRRGLDLSSVLVFATDIETRDLVKAMGVAVFYDEINYGGDHMPKSAARSYADRDFTSMMMAKVFCVQMVNFLGYDVLFQDVDVIWYRHPLTYFHNSTLDSDKVSGTFDVYFQDDGNHGLYYAPYSANTGFYYVRYNDKTRHFFNSFLMAGDLIYSTHSHQIPLVALLQEHASMYGLRVKIFPREENDFPGGHAYHRRTAFMKDLFAGAVHPYIFHMSWTLNKANKILFYRQMGEWVLRDACIQKKAQEILSSLDLEKEIPDGVLMEPCCLAEPVVTCHYKDKPSIKPCKDSPAIDKGRPSWW